MFGALATLLLAAAALSGGRPTAVGSTALAVVTDPRQVVVVLDRAVFGVKENDLEPLLRAVLADPVTVQDAEVPELSAGTFLGDPLEVLSAGDLVDTLSLRAAARLEALFAGAALSDRNAGDDDALFGFIPKIAGLVEPRRPVDPLDRALVAPFLLSLPLQFRELSFLRRFPRLPDM